LSERVRIPGVPSLVARADGALVFTDRERSIWVDLATWPPVLIERDEATIDAARSPSGAWLAYVRRGDGWLVRWYGATAMPDPSRETAEPLGELGESPRFESVHVHGDRALVVPRDVGLGDRRHPYLEAAHGWTSYRGGSGRTNSPH